MTSSDASTAARIDAGPRYDRAPAPAALLFGGDAGRRVHLSALLAERGARVAAALPLEQAGAGDGVAAAALVVADLRGTDATLPPALAGGTTPLLAAIDAAGIDASWAWFDRPGVSLLVEPSDEQLGAEIDALLRPRAARLGEDGEADRARHLARLGEEAARIARALAGMAAAIEPARIPAPRDEPGGLAATARTLLRLRRLRDRFLDRTLFADPAWDMLLDLFAAQAEARPVAVSSLCIAAAVPPTTALRWIAALTERGLIARRPDPDDGRRAFVTLTPAAADAMAGYLAAARQQLVDTSG